MRKERLSVIHIFPFTTESSVTLRFFRCYHDYMKLLPEKATKTQKNLAILGAVLFTMPAAAGIVDAIGLLTASESVPEGFLLGTLLSALLMTGLAAWLLYFGITERGEKS
jgi:hypothetical protein